MQLVYNILWIDNEIDEYIKVGEIKNLKEFLENLGFEPTIVTISEDSQLDGSLAKHKYDLILSDFQLNNTTGDEIIKNIRDRGLSTEVLFYSANADFKKSPEVKNRLAFMDRISFYIGRERLMEKIEAVISLSLSKLLELDATRGLITAATSALDVSMEQFTEYVLDKKLGADEEEYKKIVDNYVEDCLQKKPESFMKTAKKLGNKNSLKQFEAFRKWRLFRSSLKRLNITEPSDELNEFLEKNSTYYEQIIKIRNKFAHAKSEKKEGKTILVGQYDTEDYEFDIDKCISIRKDILLHKRNFENLKSYFGI